MIFGVVEKDMLISILKKNTFPFKYFHFIIKSQYMSMKQNFEKIRVSLLFYYNASEQASIVAHAAIEWVGFPELNHSPKTPKVISLCFQYGNLICMKQSQRRNSSRVKPFSV